MRRWCAVTFTQLDDGLTNRARIDGRPALRWVESG